MDVVIILFVVAAVVGLATIAAPVQLAEVGLLTFPVLPVNAGTPITQPFIPPPNGHNGIDFGAPFASALFNVAPGTVIQTHSGPEGDSGRFVIVKGRIPFEGVTWSYAHMEEIDVVVGQDVEPGDLIGLSGNSGLTSSRISGVTAENQPGTLGAHLHFHVEVNGESVDPAPFLVGAL